MKHENEPQSGHTSSDHLDAQYPDREFFEYRETFVRHLMGAVATHLRSRAAEARCLDIGSNTGRYTQMLAQRGLQVEGVDFSDDLLETARSRHPQHTFHQGDAQNLPFENDTFDGIVSLGLIQMVPDWKAAVRETVRVLKPGGIAVIETNRRFPSWEYWLKHLTYCISGRVAAEERRSVLNAHRLGPDAPNGLLRKFSPGNLMSVIRALGGVDVQLHDPRKHGVLHDFVFAICIQKHVDTQPASTPGYCAECAGGIGLLQQQEE